MSLSPPTPSIMLPMQLCLQHLHLYLCIPVYILTVSVNNSFKFCNSVRQGTLYCQQHHCDVVTEFVSIWMFQKELFLHFCLLCVLQMLPVQLTYTEFIFAVGFFLYNSIHFDCITSQQLLNEQHCYMWMLQQLHGKQNLKRFVYLYDQPWLLIII